MTYAKPVTLFIWGKDRTFQQVTKPTAAKMYEAGKLILLQTSNVPIDSFLFHPCPVDLRNPWSKDFEKVCNDYRYYNCDSERGKYIRFFVEI